MKTCQIQALKSVFVYSKLFSSSPRVSARLVVTASKQSHQLYCQPWLSTLHCTLYELRMVFSTKMYINCLLFNRVGKWASILFKRTRILAFFCVLYKKNVAFFVFFYILYKRTLRSLHSFTFFIK